jgi:hypothetical protein
LRKFARWDGLLSKSLFDGFQEKFSYLLIELYQDVDYLASSPVTPIMAIENLTNLASSTTDKRLSEDQMENAKKNAVATLNSHKLVVSLHSRYLNTMLSSGLREASESKIRLVSKYPQSLRKLLLCFYVRELVIESAEELVEMLYLADEYDVPHVMEELVRMISSRSTEFNGDSAASKTDNSPPSMEFTFENAPLFLSCSAKLNLKLEPLIFAGLAQQ